MSEPLRVTEGITSEFFWYELSQANNKLQAVQHTLDKVLATIQSREKEQLEYTQYLQRCNSELQAKINALQKE